MATTAEEMNKKRRFIGVPLVTPALSRLWISAVTGAPKALVAPLISSLRYEMIAREDPKYRLPREPQTSVRDTLRQALQEVPEADGPRAFRSAAKKQKPTVLSVQRMQLPPGKDADWAADEYIRWLPSATGWLLPLRISERNGVLSFRLFVRGPSLLRIARKPNASRPVFRVLDGLLARESPRGRLEFRTVLDGNTLIVAVHQFVPRLPWWIYRATQALGHAWVMARFRRHLRRLSTVTQVETKESLELATSKNL